MHKLKFISVIGFVALISPVIASKSGFECTLIPSYRYTIENNSILFYFSDRHLSRNPDEPYKPYGPYAIKVETLERERSPIDNKSVVINRHLLFNNRELSYANILFLSKNGELYECSGG